MKLLKIKSNDKRTSKFIYKLRNKYYVRNSSINKKIIEPKEHEKWINNFFKKNNIFYIILIKKIMAGYIRLERLKSFYCVSWAILKKYQNNGYTTKGLRIATKSKSRKYKALIKKNNFASIHIAEKANFSKKYIKKNIVYYIK